MQPQHAPPLVSVLMAVHNGMPYLPAALASVQNQTLRDIEIVVVDDASGDDSAQVLAEAAAADSRIRILTLTENAGLPRALNAGLEAARGRYVARMDADDIALPHRLEQQAADLDAHPKILLLGGSIQRMGADDAVFRTELRDFDAFTTRWIARIRAPLVHPTFMFRRTLVTEHGLRYDPALRVAQDYDFTARALGLGDVVSRGEVVLKYRVHGAAASQGKARLQAETARAIAERVQAQTLPADVAAALAPVNAALYGVDSFDARAVYRGLQALIRHDCQAHPHKAALARRQTADLMHYLICAKLGQSNWRALLSMGQLAPALIPALLRYKAAMARQKQSQV